MSAGYLFGFKWIKIHKELSKAKLGHFSFRIELYENAIWYWEIVYKGTICMSAETMQLWPDTKNTAKITCAKYYRHLIQQTNYLPEHAEQSSNTVDLS